MTHTRLQAGPLIVLVGLMSAIPLAQGPFTFVAVDGIDLHVRQAGAAVPKMPTVVFENGEQSRHGPCNLAFHLPSKKHDARR